jgi:peptide/nickel transport system substrate-binding protein
MWRLLRVALVWLSVALVLAACAPSRPAATLERADQESSSPSAFKRITAAIRAAPVSLVQNRGRGGGTVRGLDGVEELTHAGLTYLKADGHRAAQLAETVPTLENGLWKLLPDGRMETTWTIRPDARWHDGTPFTSDDLLFTAAVEQDKEIEIPGFTEYDLIDAISAPDQRTVTVTWKRPFIDADWTFSYRGAGMPLPKHALSKPYTDDKAGFTGLPFWTEEFLGTGAFKIREWVRDSHTVLRAFDDYILGRPKIDEIEVKFIPDNNTLVANMLAGVDLTLGKTISLDIALQARDQYKDGRIEVKGQNWTPINPQFIDTDPPIIADYRFRRALILALDREQLADFVFSGHGTVAYSYVPPDIPLYHLVEPYIVKYPYDLRQAAQIMDGLGYTKRSDGFLYDSAGRKLTVELRIPLQNDVHAKTAPPAADMWQRLGVAVDQVGIPIQRATDREYRAQFPGFQIVERRNSLIIAEIWRFHSSMVPLAENRWQAGGYESRWRHPDLDAALERYATTIPMGERMEALGTMVRHQTENLNQLPIFHGADPTLIANRLLNVSARGDAYTQAWNGHEWDLK